VQIQHCATVEIQPGKAGSEIGDIVVKSRRTRPGATLYFAMTIVSSASIDRKPAVNYAPYFKGKKALSGGMYAS
jgi:hypothetical protein